MLSTTDIATKYPPAFEADTGDCITGLSFSHDDRLLCATTAAGKTLIYNAHSGEQIARIQDTGAGAFWNAPHPSRNLLAIGYEDKLASVYSLDDFKKTHDLCHKSDWVEHGQWSFDGEYLATAAGKTISLWKPCGEFVFESPAHGGTVSDIQWKLSGNELAVGSYGGISLWDPADLEKMTPLAYKGSLLSIRWSPDGQWLVSGNQDSSLHIWPMKSKIENMHMSGYAVKVQYLSWNAASHFLACSNLNHVTVWNFQGKGPAGTTPEMFESVAGDVTALSYHPTEPLLLATGTAAGHIELYSHAIKNFIALRSFRNDSVHRLIWNHRGNLIVAGGLKGSLRAWKINLNSKKS